MLETMGSNLPRSSSGMEREIAWAMVELGFGASKPYLVLFPQSPRLTSMLHTSH